MRQVPLVLVALGALLLGLSCSSGSDPAGPGGDTSGVDAYVGSLPAWDTVSPPLVAPGIVQDVATGPAVIELETGAAGTFVCSTTPRSIAATPAELTTFAPGIEALYVGSLIQGSTYLGGLETMQELNIRQRAPLAITIDLLNYDNSATVTDPDAQSVGAAVGALIQSATDAGHIAGRNITWDKSECYSLEQGLLHLGFSVKYGAGAVSGDLEYSQTVEETTITAFFKDEMFRVTMVQPQTPSELFSDAFTQEKLDEQIALGTIGPNNLPVYVSSIVYGRIMVMTMTSTHSATEMKAALSASYGAVDVELTGEHLAVLQNSRISIHTVGGSAAAAQGFIATGKLGDYFKVDDPLTTAKPLTYTLRTLGGNHVAYVSETNAYDAVECAENVVDYYYDYDLWRNAILAIDGEIFTQSTANPNLRKANEVNSDPANNGTVSAVLTFPGTSTGMPLDFVLHSVQSGSNGFTYNDNEMSSNYYPMLSVGDVDNYENDDFEVKSIAGIATATVYAVGIYVGNNDEDNGEYLRVYGESDLLLKEFPRTQPGFPDGGWDFMGVVSGTPITRIYFNESANSDDICIKDPCFGVTEAELKFATWH